MLEIQAVNAEKKYIEITVNGKVTKDALINLYKDVEENGRKWGEVNVLEIIESFSGIEPAALVEDLKFFFKNRLLFKKAAVVTDIKWISTLTTYLGPLFKVNIRIFERNELDFARQWLSR